MTLKVIDRTGERYGRLVVLERAESQGPNAMWLCQCDCGKTVSVFCGSLTSGHTQSCGCMRNDMRRAARTIEESGNRYGRLLVVGRAEDKEKHLRWKCICDCGNTIMTKGSNLRSGDTSSCGCVQRDAAARVGATHAADETGHRYGRLVVIGRAGNLGGKAAWLCECDCGSTTIVRGGSLRKGWTQSCGCLRRSQTADESYGDRFTAEFKHSIRQRDLFACVLCGMPEEDNGRALCVHHVDYDKANSVPENCLSLCASCHAKTSHNREYWQKYFADHFDFLEVSNILEEQQWLRELLAREL